MTALRGQVRYRFRADDHDVNVVIEGEADWVAGKVEEFGLVGVGWTMPAGAAPEPAAPRTAGETPLEVPSQDESTLPPDMGPTPDPSRIPVVRRPIGQLDVAERLEATGLQGPSRPDAIGLMDVLEDMDPPHPVQSVTSVDPMAEAWLRELLEVVVRDHGMSGLSTEDIEEIASPKLGGREGTALEVWLESLFAAGKLVKIHGGDATGWGPSPKWLAGRI